MKAIQGREAQADEDTAVRRQQTMATQAASKDEPNDAERSRPRMPQQTLRLTTTAAKLEPVHEGDLEQGRGTSRLTEAQTNGAVVTTIAQAEDAYEPEIERSNSSSANIIPLLMMMKILRMMMAVVASPPTPMEAIEDSSSDGDNVNVDLTIPTRVITRVTYVQYIKLR